MNVNVSVIKRFYFKNVQQDKIRIKSTARYSGLKADHEIRLVELENLIN